MSPAPTGDPAFRDDDAITHAPIREEERGDAARGGGGPSVDPRSAETYVWPLAAVVLVGLAVVIGLTAGWVYAIPLAVFAGLAILFFGSHGALARWRQSRHGGVEPARRAVLEDADDPVPSTDFGERAEEPDREPAGADSPHEPHADMGRGPA
jgi:hypothetical protein